MSEENKTIELKEEDLEQVSGGKTISGMEKDPRTRGETSPAPTNTKIYDSNMADSSANPLIAWETEKNGYCKYCESNQKLLFSWCTIVNEKSCNVWVCRTCNGENCYSQSVGELM